MFLLFRVSVPVFKFWCECKGKPDMDYSKGADWSRELCLFSSEQLPKALLLQNLVLKTTLLRSKPSQLPNIVNTIHVQVYQNHCQKQKHLAHKMDTSAQSVSRILHNDQCCQVALTENLENLQNWHSKKYWDFFRQNSQCLFIYTLRVQKWKKEKKDKNYNT